MTDPLQVVCPHCDAVNRVPRARLREAPSCGRCRERLFTGRPLPLTPANFDAHVGRSGVPVVVDFWAPWCAPCRAMAPAFEGAAQVLEPGLRFAKVDTEAVPALASRFNIRSIPTLVVFHGGRELARQSGALSGPGLMAWIRGHTPSD